MTSSRWPPRTSPRWETDRVLASRSTGRRSSSGRGVASRPAGRARWTAILGLLAAGLWSCSSDPLSPLQAELRAAEQKWEAQGPTDYRYRFREFCFCGPEITSEVEILVESGTVTSAVYVEDGEPVDPSRFEQLSTVEGLFAFLQDAIDRRAHSITVEYDGALGYPESASVDYRLNVADEERGFQVTSLAPLD